MKPERDGWERWSPEAKGTSKNLARSKMTSLGGPVESWIGLGGDKSKGKDYRWVNGGGRKGAALDRWDRSRPLHNHKRKTSNIWVGGRGDGTRHRKLIC